MLTDQFETRRFRVMSPVALCNPVDKNGEGIKDPASNLVCYKIEPREFAPKRDAVVGNQFGEQILTVEGPRTLCVPSSKAVVP